MELFYRTQNPWLDIARYFGLYILVRIIIDLATLPVMWHEYLLPLTIVISVSLATYLLWLFAKERKSEFALFKSDWFVLVGIVLILLVLRYAEALFNNGFDIFSTSFKWNINQGYLGDVPLIILWCNSVFCVPIIFQLIMLGLIQKRLYDRVSVPYAIVLPALCFQLLLCALRTINPIYDLFVWDTLWYFFKNVLVGVAMGYIYYKTNRVIVPIICNILAAMAMQVISFPQKDNYHQAFILLIVMIGTGLFAIYCLTHAFAKRNMKH